MQNKNRGRDIEFKCIYCGKFVSYDRRKTIVSYSYINEEQGNPEKIVEMKHKYCEALNKKRRNKWGTT